MTVLLKPEYAPLPDNAVQENRFPAAFRRGQRVEFQDCGELLTGTIEAVFQKPDCHRFDPRPKYRIVPDPRFVTYPRYCLESQIIDCLDDLDDDLLSRGSKYCVMQHTDPDRTPGSFYTVKSDFLTRELAGARLWATLVNIDDAHNRMMELQTDRDSRTLHHFIEAYEHLADVGTMEPRSCFEDRLAQEVAAQERDRAAACREMCS